MANPKPNADEAHTRLAWWIRRLCREQGRALAKTAYAAGISHQAMFDILGGKVSPTLRTMGLIADELGVEVRDLLAPMPVDDVADDADGA